MKIENIIKKLKKESYQVYEGEFDHKPFMFCNGTALVDISNGVPRPTEARYVDVIKQIKANKSHIYTVDKGVLTFASHYKMGYQDKHIE